jgi:thimet oligopeptidase
MLLREIRPLALLLPAALFLFSCTSRNLNLEAPWTSPADVAAFDAAHANHLSAARAGIQRMREAQGERTVDNTLRPLDEAWMHLEAAVSAASLMENVHPDKAVRDAATKASQEAMALANEISLDPGVYQALAALDGKPKDLTTRHYLAKTLREFRLQGVDKDAATRDKLKALRDEALKLEQEFQRNINADTTTVTVRDQKELAGLPPDFVATLKRDAQGQWVIPTDASTVQPVMSYASDEGLRKRLYLAWRNKAYPGNVPVLQQLLAKRQQIADLLGYANWAAYITADKMTGSAERAGNFVNELLALSKAKAGSEAAELLAVARQTSPGTAAIEEWSNSYYAEQLRRQRFAFDSQQARPYFSYQHVKDGVLAITGKLFSVSYRKVKDAPVWHPSVELYEVLDGNEVIGRFYLDMHPRPDKFNHAAQFGLRPGVLDRWLPEAALVCNFPEPKEGDPALLTHMDVETFFHEFGHLLHTLLSGKHRWAGVSGIKTESDFVEAPSQLLEEWVRDPKLLQSFAVHHQTGEPIPAEMVEKINRAGRFGRGLWVSRQALYAAISLRLHQQTVHPVDTDSVVKGILREASPFPVPEEMHFEASFGHLTGYSAIYYTYLWSLTISKDLFSAFDEKNLMEPRVARRYRERILAPGGSRPADHLIRDFLGRDFSLEPFKAWLNEEDADGAGTRTAASTARP